MSQKDLEKAFIAAVKEAYEKIDKQMEIASKAINEAVKISEEYGIPFNGISDLTQNYEPKSFEKKWGALRDKIGKLSDYELGLNEYGYGWEQSATC